jgi:hypothetical protein
VLKLDGYELLGCASIKKNIDASQGGDAEKLDNTAK